MTKERRRDIINKMHLQWEVWIWQQWWQEQKQRYLKIVNAHMTVVEITLKILPIISRLRVPQGSLNVLHQVWMKGCMVAGLEWKWAGTGRSGRRYEGINAPDGVKATWTRFVNRGSTTFGLWMSLSEWQNSLAIKFHLARRYWLSFLRDVWKCISWITKNTVVKNYLFIMLTLMSRLDIKCLLVITYQFN